MASDEGLEERPIPCIKCAAPAWVLQIAVGQQCYTLWLCAEHIDQCRADFGQWLGAWLGGPVLWARTAGADHEG